VPDEPAVPVGIADRSGALSVELIGGLALDGGAELGRLSDRRVGVIDVEVDGDRRGAERGRGANAVLGILLR
jgi:hypothetical protein